MAEIDITTPPTLRVAAPKPKMTIYYALLIIALCAMLAACVFLYAEIHRLKRERSVSSIDRPTPVLLVKVGIREGIFVS